MKKIRCIECTNPACYLKKYCVDAWITRIDERKSQAHYKANQIIIHEGTPVLGIHFILNGKVKVYFTGSNDKPQIVRFANDGHILGHKGLGMDDHYPLSAATMDDSIICHIDNELLGQLFNYNPALVVGLMEFYSRELRKAEDRIKNLTQMNVKEKIAEALIALYESFGLNDKQEIDVPFSREDIAATAGSSIPQVATQLTEFENEHYIDRRGKHGIALLNLPGLQKLLEQYNFHSIKQ